MNRVVLAVGALVCSSCLHVEVDVRKSTVSLGPTEVASSSRTPNIKLAIDGSEDLTLTAVQEFTCRKTMREPVFDLEETTRTTSTGGVAALAVTGTLLSGLGGFLVG